MTSYFSAVEWCNQRLLLFHSMLRGMNPVVFLVNLSVNCLVSAFRLVFPLCTAYLLYSLYLYATSSPCLLYPYLPTSLTRALSPLTSPHPTSHLPLHLHPLPHLLLLLPAAVEFAFFFYLWHRSRVLQRRRAPPPLSADYREIFIRRVLIAICKVAGEDERCSLVGDDKMMERARRPHHSLLSPSTPLVPLTSVALPQPPPLLPEPPAPLRRLSLSEGQFDVRKILQGWFYNAPLEDIWEGNIIQWLCHGLFHRDWAEMTPYQHEEMMELWDFLKAGGRSKEERERARVKEENRLFYPSRTTIDRAATVAVLPGVGSTPWGEGEEPPLPDMARSYSDAAVEGVPAGLPPPSRVQIHPGFNTKTRCMRVIIDPIQYQHRPLFLYGIVAGVHFLYTVYLRRCGYVYYKTGQVEYFHRPPTDPTAPVKPALVFVHGISNGISSYHSFVRRLHEIGNQHIFLLLLPFISMRLHEDVPTAKDTVESLKDAMIRHTAEKGARDPPRFILIGHSYGSLVVSWFVKAFPHLLLSTVMIDPVCFLLFLPHLCYNFLYRQPISPMHHILSFFAAKELFISHTLHRHFFWTVNVLWIEDVTHICEAEEQNKEAERDARQVGENWQQKEASPTASHANGHVKRRRPIQRVAVTGSASSSSRSSPSPEPELVLNAAISPLLRAPRVIERLPKATKSRPPPSKCYVFLSEKDDLIYAPAVYSYLCAGRAELMDAQVETRWREQNLGTGERKTKAELVHRLSEVLVCIKMWKHFRHAQFLTSRNKQRQVIEAINAAEGMMDLSY